MSVLQRAATFAVMAFSLAGLLGHSAPGYAQTTSQAVVDQAVLPQPVPNSNTPDPIAVPQDDPVFADDTLAAATSDTFASLAEAVAAHDGAADNDALRCLAGAIYFEAKGEPLAGQLAVAEVIINRSRSGRFPADLCGVVLQRGQFGFVRAGAIPAIDEGRAAYRTALAVARVALTDAWDSPASDALYFNRPGARPAGRIVKVASLGNHVFYR